MNTLQSIFVTGLSEKTWTLGEKKMKYAFSQGCPNYAVEQVFVAYKIYKS